MLPHAGEGRDPTRLFGAYNTVATLAGSLAAGCPTLLLPRPAATLAGLPGAGGALAVAAGLSTEVEAGAALRDEPRPRASVRAGSSAAVGAVRARLAEGRLRHAGVHRLLVTERWGRSPETTLGLLALFRRVELPPDG